MENSSSPLEDLRYSHRASDLVRFIEDSLDEAIGSVATEAFATDDQRREALRRSIDEQGAYTLLLFAMRRSASALRTRSLRYALQAIQGLTLITRDTIDYRDLEVDFPLYAARELGADMRSLVRNAVSVSEPGVAGYFAARATGIAERTLEDCALMEVRSSYGLGYMSTWGKSYEPSTDLAGGAVRLADRIDAEGTYAVNGLHTSSLPSVWFGEAAGRDPRTTGCVSFDASLLAGTTGRGHQLLVFLAELPDRQLCSTLAVRAAAETTLDRPRVAVAYDRRLALFVGGSYVQGETAVETAKSLGRFGAIGRGLLEELSGTAGG